jgi:hypothetical protein
MAAQPFLNSIPHRPGQPDQRQKGRCSWQAVMASGHGKRAARIPATIGRVVDSAAAGAGHRVPNIRSPASPNPGTMYP